MVTPTTNAVPSQSPIDLLFNAEQLDIALNSSSLTYVDRKGVTRLTVAGAIARISGLNVRGAWATATAYVAKDIVSNSGTWYVALDNHTSGATFAGDLSAHWRVYQGVIAPDLASTTDALKGSGMLGYAISLAYAAGTVGLKLGSFVTPEDFGAVGDGTTSDQTAVQNFFNYLAANGGLGILGRRKRYKLTDQITLTSPTYGFMVQGCGPQSEFLLRASTAVSAFGFVAPHDIILQGFRIDVGFSGTGFGTHGVSMRNAQRCTGRDLEVYDYSGSAGLTFVDADDTYGDCHWINCDADGSGNAQNGWLHEGMLRSSIQNCKARGFNPSGSPCVGLQLKNRCKYSWIDGGEVEGAKSGIAFGGDGTTFGDGPFNCWARGVITKNCLDGATIGKSTDCVVDFTADQTGSPAPGTLTGYALNVAGANLNLQAVVRIKGVQAGRTSILVRSNDVSIFVPYANGIGSKLLELTSGVNRCRVTVQDIADSGVTNLADYVTDGSGTSTNEVLFLRDLPGGGLTGSNQIKLPVAGKTQNWMAFSGSTETFNWRINGTDRLALSAAFIRPAVDNSMDSGTASFRIKQHYAANSTILTSDEREKQGIAPITDAVLDAWAEVEWVTYLWREAVATKGEAARVHFGLIAQRVRDAFERRGLDPFRYGVLCHDEWPDQWEPVLDDQGNTVGTQLVKTAGDRYGVRYDQALVLEAALTRRELARMRKAA